MSRLDQHVSLVRNKLALGTFLVALGWTLTGFAAAVWAYILANRYLTLHLPRPAIWFWVGAAIAFVAAVAWAIWRRPSQHQAAVAIDQTLGLKEKFSTALYVRPSSDPFAAAAVRDAEVTADNVSLAQRFPVRVPMSLAFTALAFAIAFASSFLKPNPLFANPKDKGPQAQADQEKARQDTRKLIEQTIARIEETPRTEQNKETLEAAKREMFAHRDNPNLNVPAAQRSAQKALQEMDAIKEKVKEMQKQAIAENQVKAFKSMAPPNDPNSPVAKVQEAIGQGKLSEAVNELEKVVKQFDKMDQKEKEKAAQDMDKLAQQLQKLAQDPKVQQQVQQQLQKMGANQQQMQQLANQVQQAAAGDKQAQQAVQQMANQIAQGINNNPNLSPQQQQQIAQQVQQLVGQMQGQANQQQTAQQLGQAAQAMAKAMQQAAQNGGQQQAKPAGGQQQQMAQGGAQPGANPQQQGNQPGQQGAQPGGQQQGAQAGAGQPGGQQPGQQPGQGQGQQPGQGQGQGLADAQAQMQQQLEQMQQAADDAAAMAQEQANAGQGAGQGNGPGQGQGQDGQKGEGGQGQGKFAQGNADARGGGSGGPGISDGGPRPAGQEAPAGFKREQSPSHTLDDGKILASTFVKAMSEKGTSKVGLADVVEAAQKEATDEVEQDRVSRPAQSVVKRYFDDLKRGAEGQE